MRLFVAIEIIADLILKIVLIVRLLNIVMEKKLRKNQ